MTVAPIVSSAQTIFPNIHVELQDDRPTRTIEHRRVGRYAVTLLKTPGAIVETVRWRACSAGFDRHMKLVWQLAGSMRYEDADRAFEIEAGNLVLMSLATDSRLEMREGFEALVLPFDPAENPEWASATRDAMAIPLPANAGVAASAAGTQALLSGRKDDRSGELAAHTMIGLALSSASCGDCAVSEPPILARASLKVLRNLSDGSYGPERLARDMGMSRRSLYTRFAEIGTTPAAYIRRIRLERAYRDVLQDRNRPLIDIALSIGFTDGASLSRAFREAYGRPPSVLRAEN